MKSVALSAIFALIGLPAVGFSQTCASPLPMPSNMTINGNTCDGPAGLDFGGATIPHHYKVYAFTYQDDSGTSPEPDQIAVSGTDMNAIVGTDCATAPIGGAAVGAPYSVEGLTPGAQYIVVVTTDPSIAVPAGGPICDDYSVATDTLPVKLQKFSVN